MMCPNIRLFKHAVTIYSAEFKAKNDKKFDELHMTLVLKNNTESFMLLCKFY